MNVGLIGTAEVTVNTNNTAASVGSGLLPVFSTPSMIALLEMAACNAIESSLDEGSTSVGTDLKIKHLAATPIGMKVTATATLTQIDGRRLVFDIKVCDEVSLIGEGTHERFIVFGDKFLAKTNAKLQK
jgi:predicted thioesterase